MVPTRRLPVCMCVHYLLTHSLTHLLTYLLAVGVCLCSRTAETGGVAERMAGGLEDILSTVTMDGGDKN